MNSPIILKFCRSALFAAILGAAMFGFAQSTAPSSDNARAEDIRDLQDQVRQLRALVDEMRSENAQSRAEMHQLRQDLQATRSLLERPEGANANAAPSEPTASTSASNASATPTRRALLKIECKGWKTPHPYLGPKLTSNIRPRSKLHRSIEQDCTGLC